MEKIFTVGFSAEKVADLGFSNIDLPSLVEKDDSEIHNFIINKFKENEIEKLIFDLSINPVLVIKLAFHIRLGLQELKSKSLLPILFTSTESFQTIIGKCGKWSSIFTTKGIYFAPFHLVKIDIENIVSLKSNEYKNSFLDLIQISPDEIDGKHSIANQWGAFALEQAANTNILRNDENLKKTFNKLYFKYINAYLLDYKLLEKESHIKGTIYIGNANAIDATSKKVLLIDDEADKGWDLVLRKIFKNADFKIINEKVSNYNAFSNEAKQLIEQGNFDLFLVDLRLNGIQEEEFIPIEHFSGTNVLKEIKRQNRGNQVIMFTASNKAWNIKPLLDFGADGYYIKESPEYMFSAKISESNYLIFKMNVNSCFNRNYLKSIFNSIDKLKIKLNHLIGVYDQKFLDEIQVLLDQSFDMHYNAKTEKQFAYAYVTLYMIIEIINQRFITKQSDDTYEILDVGNLLDWKFEKDKYSNTDIDVKGNKPPEWQKIAGIYFQKWNKTDKNFIQKIHSLIQKRNGFVHNDKSILEKQNNAGKYINRDVFNKDGFVELFNCIEVLINLL